VTDGHRTSTIPRPRVDARPEATPRPAARKLLEDFTTPIARDKQIVPQRRGRLALAAVATLIALAIGAALFVLPVKSWLKQRHDLGVRTSELETLNSANDQLQSEVDRLQTDDGIRDAARTEIDYVPDGEKRVTVLPLPAASTALPSGWPYSVISSILAIRQAEAAAATAATASTAAPVTTTVAASVAPTAVTTVAGGSTVPTGG
jgi:cell division protein FtsB